MAERSHLSTVNFNPGILTMTPSERGPLQKLILDGARDVPGARPTQAKVAEVMGFSDTEYRRFEEGKRKLDLDEIVAACEHEEFGGAAKILGALASHFGLLVVERPSGLADGERPLVLAAGASGAAGALIQHILGEERPDSDGGVTRTPGELTQRMRRIEEVEGQTARLRAQTEADLRAVAPRAVGSRS